MRSGNRRSPACSLNPVALTASASVSPLAAVTTVLQCCRWRGKAKGSRGPGSFEDVVKFTIFIVGLTPEKRKAVTEVRGRYISHKNPPAATMIGVDKLVEPGLLLEIEAIAAIG